MNSNNDPNNKGTQNDLPLNEGQSFETGSPSKHDHLFGKKKEEDFNDPMTSFDDDNWDKDDSDNDFNDQNFNDEFDDTQQTSGAVINNNPSFLKKNFHYLAIGGVALVGGYLVLSTLFSSPAGQDTVAYQDPGLTQALPNTQTAAADNPFAVSGSQDGAAPTGPVLEQQGVPAGANDVGLLMGGDVTSQNIQQQVLADNPATNGFAETSDWGSEQPPMPAPVSKDVATEASDAEGFTQRQVIDVPVPPPAAQTPTVADTSLPATSPEDQTAPLLTQQPPTGNDLTIAKEIQATGSNPAADILAPTDGFLADPSAPKVHAVAPAPVLDSVPTATTSVTPKATQSTPSLTPSALGTTPSATPSLVTPDVKTAAPQETQTYVENEQIEFLRQNLANAETRIKTLDNRFEVIMGRLEELNQKISLIQAGGGKAPSSADTKELQDRIKDLEKDVKDAKSSSSDASVDAQEKSFPRSNTKKDTSSAPVKKQAKKEKKPDTKKITQKPSVEIPKSTASTSSWVLRAAQPNVAWISQGQDAPIKRVVVGETLPYLGQVQSVTIENGRWIVRGTQATITQ